MSKNNFELELTPLPSAFDEVVERLCEAIVLHPQCSNSNQLDFTTHPKERTAQILYYLQKTILIDRHADLAIEFTKVLLEDDNLPF
jgi:hypothetical protein